MNTRLRQRLVLPAVTVVAAAGLVVAATLGQASAAPTASPRYEIHVNGVKRATFTTLVAASAADLLPDQDQQPSAADKKLPENQKPLWFTLERPLTKSASNQYLHKWHRDWKKGETSGFRDATLQLYDTDGRLLFRFRLTRARPTAVETAPLKAGDDKLKMRAKFVVDSMHRTTT